MNSMLKKIYRYSDLYDDTKTIGGLQGVFERKKHYYCTLLCTFFVFMAYGFLLFAPDYTIAQDHHTEPPYGELTTLSGHSGWVLEVAWSPNGQYLASCGAGEFFKIWSTSDWHEMEIQSGSGSFSPIVTLAWSPSGEYIAGGTLDGTIEIWRVSDFTLEATLHSQTDSVTSTISDLAWNPTGEYIASVSTEGPIKIWQVTDWKEIRVLSDHKNLVACVAWSPNSQYMASGSYDNTIKIWQMGDWNCVQTLNSHFKAIQSVAWSPNDDYLVSEGADSSIVI